MSGSETAFPHPQSFKDDDSAQKQYEDMVTRWKMKEFGKMAREQNYQERLAGQRAYAQRLANARPRMTRLASGEYSYYNPPNREKMAQMRAQGYKAEPNIAYSGPVGVYDPNDLSTIWRSPPLQSPRGFSSQPYYPTSATPMWDQGSMIAPKSAGAFTFNG